MAPTIVVQEGTEDLDFLSQNHYNLQVAKGVSAPGGEPKFNVVYDSEILGPNMTVEWTPKYGINWTTKIPNPGVHVTYTGRWQPCDLGDSYDLTDTGGWIINNNDPHRDESSVNVGKNGYATAVHVIVGILNEGTGAWQAFFVSPDKLPPKGYGQYQPRDNIKLWYGEGLITETMISTQSTEVEDFDMTNVPLQYFRYIPANGDWLHSPKPFDPPK
ncbi:hypothetical protein NHJ13734_004964 [Beauveria thailandica]